MSIACRAEEISIQDTDRWRTFANLPPLKEEHLTFNKCFFLISIRIYHQKTLQTSKTRKQIISTNENETTKTENLVYSYLFHGKQNPRQEE